MVDTVAGAVIEEVATNPEGAVEAATIRAAIKEEARVVATRVTTISSKEGATRTEATEEQQERSIRERAAADSTTTTSTTHGAVLAVEAVVEEGGTKAIGAVSALHAVLCMHCHLARTAAEAAAVAAAAAWQSCIERVRRRKLSRCAVTFAGGRGGRDDGSRRKRDEDIVLPPDVQFYKEVPAHEKVRTV